MSEAGDIGGDRHLDTKTSKAEKLLKKLTSQPCIKKAGESCVVTNSTQPSDGTSDDSPPLNESGTGDSYTNELKLRIASSSAEILENVRRDSGDHSRSDSFANKIKYSKGESIDLNGPIRFDSDFKVRPALSQKFRPGVVNQIIEDVIKEHLTGKEYSAEEAKEWTQAITESIQTKTREQSFARYKIIVSVVLGEKRSQGISTAYRCLWDAESDCTAAYTFINDSMYCVGMVYGIYFY